VSGKIAVKTEQLTRRFGDFTAVDQVSFQVYQGEIFGFLGPNGAGKTTLIRMLCGLLQPTAGEGWVAGFNIRSETEKIKRNIGYMSQRFSLYEDLKVEENIEFYGGIYGLSAREIEEGKKFIYQELGLAPFHKMITANLPLGFKQRLALGTSMIHHPPIVFLDEPTSGVDPRARRAFWDIIYKIAEGGTTVFVTTHYMEEAEYCNRVSIIRDGKIVVTDSPVKLKKKLGKETMQEVFLSLVRENIVAEK